MQETRIYNYFFHFEEFHSYLQGKKFEGTGISSFSDPEKSGNSAKAVLSFDAQKGLVLKLSPIRENRGASEYVESDWVRKEDWFVWQPAPGEEVSFQALDAARLHLHWKSQQDILFSGTLDSRKESFGSRILIGLKKLFRRQ